MPDVSFTNLLVVAAVAVLAPLTVGYSPRLRIPAVVLEIVGGIIIGPSVLGWVHIDLPVQILALFGLAFLLFLAGLEIDVHRLRGRLLRYAVLGYLVSLVLGYGAGASFTAVGWVSQPLLLAITLASTALGLIVPVLKDARQIHSEIGQSALAAASVADFTAIVLLSLFFSSSGGSTGSKVVILGAFAGLVAVTGLAVSGAARSMRLGQVLLRLQDTTAEIRVRFAVLLLVAFTALAERFGLEAILGAFPAGVGAGPGVPAGPAGGARPARADRPARQRHPGHAGSGAAPGHLAAVHRDRHADRRDARQDHPGDGGRAGVCRAAVGADFPADRTHAATPGEAGTCRGGRSARARTALDVNGHPPGRNATAGRAARPRRGG